MLFRRLPPRPVALVEAPFSVLFALRRIGDGVVVVRVIGTLPSQLKRLEAGFPLVVKLRVVTPVRTTPRFTS